MTKVIRVAEEFSVLPSGRSKSDGSHTGEHFQERLIHELKNSSDDIQINFDGVLGVGSSFLDESFAGLVRKKIINKQDFSRRIKITSAENPEIPLKVERYVNAVV